MHVVSQSSVVLLQIATNLSNVSVDKEIRNVCVNVHLHQCAFLQQHLRHGVPYCTALRIAPKGFELVRLPRAQRDPRFRVVVHIPIRGRMNALEIDPRGVGHGS